MTTGWLRVLCVVQGFECSCHFLILNDDKLVISKVISKKISSKIDGLIRVILFSLAIYINIYYIGI
jgi:hypothetical protein